MNTIKDAKEWLRQAKYDLDTAGVMFKGRRYIYCVFMSHLAVEKVLKALYVQRLKRNPPKTHSLVYLAQSINIELPSEMKEFLERLNELSVPTRYPEELKKLLREYQGKRTALVYAQAKKALRCLAKELKQ